MTDIEDILSSNKKLDKFIPICNELATINISDKHHFEKICKQLQHKYKINISHNDLLKNYNLLLDAGKIKDNINIERFAIKRKVRDSQGVIVITVVMSDKPNGINFTCAYDCSYCPNVPGYARSYYPDEPAVERGKQNNWEPILQVHNRINQYIKNGIMLDTKDKLLAKDIKGYKIDMIIEGGTFTSYPINYRSDFIHKLFYACNTFYDDKDRNMLSLSDELKLNENSFVRIIGLSIETRPDTININIIKELRKHGVTRVQLGVQHLDDEILRINNRRCYTKHTQRALKLLYDNCFKVAIHIMLDLPGSSYEKDLEMIDRLFNDNSLQADYFKLYPCMTLPYTKIIDMYNDGSYKPYSNEKVIINVNGVETVVDKIIPVSIEFLRQCKPYNRVERVLRDLPVKEVVDGCKTTNLRQILKNIMDKNNIEVVEIRHKEVRDNTIDMNNISMFEYKYYSSGGVEYFITYETNDNKFILGFIRLRLPDLYDSVCMDDLLDCALIREIHIYGQSVAVGNNTINYGVQNKGLGTNLLKHAEYIATTNKYKYISVISGEGVKGFYRKHGFDDSEFYMKKRINFI